MQDKVKKITKIMERLAVDYLLLGPSTNFYYLTGLHLFDDERLQLLILDQEGNLSLIVPEMYRTMLEENLISSANPCYWSDEEDPAEIVVDQLGEARGRLAIDDDLRYLHFSQLGELLTSCECIKASRIMSQLRIIKHERELANLIQAAEIADRVGEEMVGYLEPGLSESQVSIEMENRLKEYSREGVAFSPLVAAGANSASPHHISGDYILQEGDFVSLDFGCTINGYSSDMTRTYSLGEPTEEMELVYNTVREAQEAAIQSVVPGVKCSEVDAAARNHIAENGYGDYFIHRTGHGIGLDYHEEPYIVFNNHLPLKPGMVFTIEPGIYLPGKYGVRIEDVVAVTAEGVKVLNMFTKELIII